MTAKSCLVRLINSAKQRHTSDIPKFIGFTEIRGNYSTSRLTNVEVQKKRSELFSQEQFRQKKLVSRIEKIEVEYKGLPEDASLVMNKYLSTPFNCAQHIGEMLTQRSALAEVNGQPWDMHRPLEADCQLRLWHMKDDETNHVNRAFWRSCSMLLGMVVDAAFKDTVGAQLHSFPSPNIKSGSFLYDVDLSLPKWEPTKDEMRILSAQFARLLLKEMQFERLEVDGKTALQMFEDNKHKSEQIPQIAAQSESGNSVTLYRVGDHVDISRGPMISNTGLIGRCSVVAVHKLETDARNLYRIQGIALPKGIMLNHYAYGLLENRAKKLNPARLPGDTSSVNENLHQSEAVIG